jgi:hypothetical protein
MKLITDVDEVLTTTRTVRFRLDFVRAVFRELIEECLRIAQQSTIIPVAHIKGLNLNAAHRLPVKEILRFNTWGKGE